MPPCTPGRSILSAPFFLLAWTAGRRPRTTGALLVAASVFFVHFFGLFRNDHLSLMTQGVTFVLFVGPLLASGIALVGHRPDAD